MDADVRGAVVPSGDRLAKGERAMVEKKTEERKRREEMRAAEVVPSRCPVCCWLERLAAACRPCLAMWTLNF